MFWDRCRHASDVKDRTVGPVAGTGGVVAIRPVVVAGALVMMSPWIGSSPLAAQQPPADDVQLAILRPADVVSQEMRLTPVSDQFERVVVTALAADPTGRLIAVAGDDLAIRLIDAETMTVVTTILPEGEHHHRDRIRTLTFDSQGDRLASAGNDGRVVIYRRVAQFQPTESMDGAPAITSLRFSPDGQQMAAVGFDEEIFLIGRAAGLNRLRCGCRDLRFATYSDDGGLLAVGGRVGDVHLYDPAKAVELGEHAVHTGRVQAAEFRGGTRTLVTVGDDGTLAVLDCDAKRVIQRVSIGECRLFSITMIDSKLAAAGGSDNGIHVIDTDGGVALFELTGHTGTISDVVRSGRWLYSGGYDATVRRWPIDQIRSLVPQLSQGDSRLAEGPVRIDR